MDPAERIAIALERIADALEPSPKGEWGNFFDQVAYIGSMLCVDGEESDRSALVKIAACVGDINEAVCGGMLNKRPITDSLEDIAAAANNPLTYRGGICRCSLGNIVLYAFIGAQRASVPMKIAAWQPAGLEESGACSVNRTCFSAPASRYQFRAFEPVLDPGQVVMLECRSPDSFDRRLMIRLG